MNKILAVAAAVGALGVSAFGQAQKKYDFTPYNYGFRLGASFAQDSALNETDDTLLTIGVDYNFGTSILRRGDSFASLDLASGEFGAEDGSLWSLMMNNRFYFDEVSKQSYLIVGIGALFTDLDESDVLFGGRVGLGFNVGENLYLVGQYTFGQKTGGDINPAHTGFFVGYRF